MPVALTPSLQQLSDSAAQHWPQLAAGAAGLYCIYKLFTFIRADADLRLLAKRRPPPDAFEDKVVWITGASQGLGAELARYCAARGAFLILTARREDRLQAVKASCRGKYAPEGVRLLPLDLCADFPALAEAAAEADAAFATGPDGASPGVDFLIHNVGASQHAAVEEASSESLDRLFQVNAIAPLRLTRAVLPFYISREKGRFVVVSSIAGLTPAPGQSGYSASKHALTGYFRTLQAELWNKGVGVTLCYPGPIGGDAEVGRAIYGAEGIEMKREDEASAKKKMTVARVAELVATAAFHGLDSAWIARHPVLLLAYLVQYWPSLGFWAINTVGPGRVAQLKAGRSGYDFGDAVVGSKKSA